MTTNTISNAGLVHITGAGTCIVVASQSGNTNYLGSVAAPDKEHTISINQAAITTVTYGAGPFIYDDSAIHPAEKNSKPAHTGDRAPYSLEEGTRGWGTREECAVAHPLRALGRGV